MLFRIGRWALPLSWAVAAAGCYGPWVAHDTAALTLTGPDLAEFVKFLPAVTDGSLSIVRQAFYLPILAIVLGVAALVWAPRLHYSGPVRAAAVLLSIPVSTQLLPPAWSPASLLSAEFRLQPIALGLCWLALAASWLLGRLPLRWTCLGAAVLDLAAAIVPAWQYARAKPAIDAVYGRPPDAGWGLALCVTGLLLGTAAALTLAATEAPLRHPRSQKP